MTAIKLIQIGQPMHDGTLRLQSQLLQLKKSNVADFILQKGVLKIWDKGKNGFGFYPYSGNFEIVTSEEEIKNQKL